MGTGDAVTLTLKGGAPWGFRLQGGGPFPLKVSKIRKKSQAHAQGMQEGDTIVSINGIPTSGRTHDEAMRIVDASGSVLTIEIFRGNMPDVSTIAGTVAPIINTKKTVEDSGPKVTSKTSTTYDDGSTKKSVKTESFVEKGDGRETRGFLHKEHTTSVVKDQWAPTKAPLPSLLDTSVSSQPFSSQPVQVQVSAMFSNTKDDKENCPPQPSPTPSPMFNVRKVTTTASTSSTTRQDSWKPLESSHKNSWQSNIEDTWKPLQSNPLLQDPTDILYPQFPLPEVKKLSPTGKKKGPPPPPPPRPDRPVHPQEIPLTRVRDIKSQLLSPKRPEDEDVESLTSQGESITSGKHHHRMPVFAPPIQISLHAGERDDLSNRPHDLDLVRTMSVESEVSSPTSSLDSKKKIFSDSAFYNDPEKQFPTIQEQMKLCKIIAHSLTAAANKKARGAKMFAKRQKRSPRWVHDGSLVLDVDLEDLPGYNTHYYEDDDDVHLQFKIPKVKNRVTSPDTETKMSLSQEEFERLRLQSQKCEHQNVSPNQCFDIAQSLKHSKGKAGKLFEKRRQRAEKYVIDETNAQKSPVKPTKPWEMSKPLKGSLSPWEAALVDPSGCVEKAFDELSEFERKQKLNQMMKMKPAAPPAPAPRPVTPPLEILVKQANLRADDPFILRGKNFNRKARGWGGGGEGTNDIALSYSPLSGSSSPVPTSQPAPQPQVPQFRNYNPKPRAWRTSAEYEPMYQGYNSSYASDSSNIMSPTGYHNSSPFAQGRHELPGTDL